MLFAEEITTFFRCENSTLKLFTDTPSLPFKKKNVLYYHEVMGFINKMNVLIQWVFL